jgi:predicted amidophosphoribosyltransferase
VSRNKARCQGVWRKHHWQRGICSRCGEPRNPDAKPLGETKPPAQPGSQVAHVGEQGAEAR